jgi:CheY-like chemotaxis protein
VDATSILVVDDDAAARYAVCALLEAEGYSTAQVQNGQEALDYLRSNPRPILILLDLMMPVMDGWKFMTKHSNDESISMIPVLVVTASPVHRRIGPHRVLHKPFDADHFLAIIAEYGRESGA